VQYPTASFERSLASTSPRSIAKIAVLIGLAGLGMMFGISRTDGLFGVSPGRAPSEAIRKFEPKFKLGMAIAQGVFSMGAALSGGGLFFRKQWGRIALQGFIWLYLAFSVIATPALIYMWFLVLRDRTRVFDGVEWAGYGVLTLFCSMAFLVLAALFKALLLIVRRLRSQEFREWTSPIGRSG